MKFAEDFLVFAFFLLFPLAAGFYFAFRGGKQRTTNEFLLADKNLRSWLVALSLVASYFSSVVLLGATAEVFTYGIQYIILAILSYWIVAGIVHVLFIPMFHRLKVTSVNEVSVFSLQIFVLISGSKQTLLFEKVILMRRFTVHNKNVR